MDELEFWSMETVTQRTGLSRSKIYRLQKEGSFPRSRQYRNSTRVFWVSTDVRKWMAGQLEDVAGLIG